LHGDRAEIRVQAAAAGLALLAEALELDGVAVEVDDAGVP
jgi:hypothetical protein